MNIGVSAFAWTADFRESHLDVLPAVRKKGLSVFEVPMFNPGKLPAKQIRRAMEANDLACTVCAIMPSGINPISPDAAVRKKSLGHLIECVEVSAELGAKLIAGPVYAPIGYLPGRRRSPEEWEWALDALRSLAPTLDVHGSTLAIEPVNRSETFFLTSAKDAKVFCDVIDHSRIGVTIDTFHANIEEKNIAEAIRLLGARLKHIHVSENDRGLLGSGHVDFAGIIATLRERKYDGCLMIEGFGYSINEQDAAGVVWADLVVSPERIAFEGFNYLQGLAN